MAVDAKHQESASKRSGVNSYRKARKSGDQVRPYVRVTVGSANRVLVVQRGNGRDRPKGISAETEIIFHFGRGLHLI